MSIKYSNGILKEKENIRRYIYDWSKGNEKVLNIITIPYNPCDLIIEEIMDYVDENKKVLYITNCEEGFLPIVNYLKKIQYNSYSCIINKIDKVWEKSNIVLSIYERATSYLGEYDLVVYDDITTFSPYNKFEILELLSNYYTNNSKIICRSLELVFQNAPFIELPAREEGIPLSEPRIITTRLDIKKEIPYVIYDYINWSIYSGRNILIFVPDLGLGEYVYSYLLNLKKSLKNIVITNGEFDINNYKGVIITDSMEYLNKNIMKTDFIVYSADEKFFEYKKLVYVCSKCESGKNGTLGEVVFLAKEISRDMENCRDIIRRFNKIAWKRKLLNF